MATSSKDDNSSVLASWAKLNSVGYHPLLYHMVDVAMVAAALWRTVLAPSARRSIAEGLQLDEVATERWTAFWAGLHDLGKASPAFQWRGGVPETVLMELREAGLQRTSVTVRAGRAAPHGTITAAVLPAVLISRFGLQDDVARRAAAIAGGHHGVFPSSDMVRDVGQGIKGGHAWEIHRANLIERLATLLEVPTNSRPAPFGHSTAMKLAGLISVADWIGSNTTYFGYASPKTVPDLAAYRVDRERQAAQALRELGWSVGLGAAEPRPFSALFARIEPNLLQQTVEGVAHDLTAPGLVIIEAPMGEGKTEAALYLADHWTAALGQRGSYFALPTQATSNQMFTRVRAFLSDRFSDSPGIAHLQLLHGHAALSAEFAALRRNEELFKDAERFYRLAYQGGEDGAHHVAAAEWFTYRKRGLLAPFGVGTVDQALLAVLQTRHVFVRLFGLSHKTVVIDEAHAYDTYMTALLERLLEWLAALGSSVVILSATLPRQRRQKLVAAYSRGLGLQRDVALPAVDYPRVTWLAGSNAGARYVQTSERSRKKLRLQWVDSRLPETPGAPFGLGERLRTALARGGCAAVVCNTVRRAQEVYRALKPFFPGEADDNESELDLLHAQFLFEERERREQRALRRFGKEGQEVTLPSGEKVGVRRPQSSVLVATQVIEQSLDLDFDLMVTEMAPVDLLLQRAGRLHRHERTRPSGLEEPQLWVMGPEVTSGVPAFESGTTHVYHRHVLLRSWLALHDEDLLPVTDLVRVPEDVEKLIEAVYDDSRSPDGLPGPLQKEWGDSKKDLGRKRNADEGLASQFRILPPHYPDDILEDFNRELEEDDPSVHPTLQALTRQSDPSVSIVFLQEAEARALKRTTRPNISETKGLLQHSLSVSHRELVRILLNEKEKRTPSGWRRSPLLRHHLLIELGDSSNVEIGREYVIELNEELGLRILRKGNSNAEF